MSRSYGVNARLSNPRRPPSEFLDIETLGGHQFLECLRHIPGVHSKTFAREAVGNGPWSFHAALVASHAEDEDEQLERMGTQTVDQPVTFQDASHWECQESPR